VKVSSYKPCASRAIEIQFSQVFALLDVIPHKDLLAYLIRKSILAMVTGSVQECKK
jgi:hypothetical protein